MALELARDRLVGRHVGPHQEGVAHHDHAGAAVLAALELAVPKPPRVEVLAALRHHAVEDGGVELYLQALLRERRSETCQPQPGLGDAQREQGGHDNGGGADRDRAEHEGAAGYPEGRPHATGARRLRFAGGAAESSP